MIKIYNDNCINVLARLETQTVDLTVTSPPYDNLRDYEGSLIWSEEIWKHIISQLYRVTKLGGVVVWIVGDATINGSETGTSFRQALYAQEVGFNLHDTMIWNKGGFVAVGALKVRYGPVFDYMFVWSKGRPKTFNPLKDRLNKNAGRVIGGTKRQSDGSTKPLSKSWVSNDFGQRFNIWDIFPVRQRGDSHPAPFPEELVRDHIISWSNEGDLVFDPFMGSGTTGKVAKELGRDFVGVEKELKYFTMAERKCL